MAAATTTRRSVGVLVAAFVVLGIGVLVTYLLLQNRGVAPPTPGQQRCVATANGASAVLSLDQAEYASIIVGVSVKRDLPPRAATIALTTAYQESGIRNLDYGDRDSVGLFQQRPSQGWGTEKQLMDPYYATNKFYDALVKIKNWSTRDITKVAQAIQRSGYPDAYRDHESDARIVASALTGHSPGGWTCLEREGNPGKPVELVKALNKTFGKLETERSDNVVTVTADTATHAWAYGNFAIANSRKYGVVEVVVADKQWRTDPINLPAWVGADEPIAKTEVRIVTR